MVQDSTWSGPTPFVGRKRLLEELLDHVENALSEGGRAVFLLGPPGSGKTAALGLLQELAFRRQRDLRAEYVNCAQSGEKTWLELARLFTRGHRLRRSAWRVAMEWLDVTQIGAVLTAGWRTVRAMRTGELPEEVTGTRRSPSETGAEAVRMLTEYGSLEPRLVILDSLDRGDAEDLAGAFALVQRLPETRTVFVAAVRTKAGRLPRAIDDLILETERLGRASRVDVPVLSPEEIREAVEKATRSTVPADHLAWLTAECRGVPAALWSALGRLEQEGALRKTARGWRWEDFRPPELTARPEKTVDVSGLDDEDLRVLTFAAVEGQIFHSTVVAELTGVSELDLEDRFSRLCRVGVLDYRGVVGPAGEVSSEYAFSNTCDAEVFAAGFPEMERAGLAAHINEIKQRLGLTERGP